MGKTTLLRDAADQAHGMRVLRARGIESESELPFAALSELLSPLLDLRAEIPPVQAQAIGGALALEATPVTDRFAVAAGVLSLLAAAAERQPVLAIADDLQWLDEASREALLFAARRLDAEGVVLLFGAARRRGRRRGRARARPLPLDRPRRGERAHAARRRAQRLRARRDRPARRRVGRQPARAARDPARADRRPARRAATSRWRPLRPGDTLERAFRRRVDALPEPTRGALLVAACAETMRADVIAGALANAGFAPDALEPAEAAGLLALRGREIEFDHPLVRAAVYHAATPAERRDVHDALAAAFPDRSAERAWHRAAACSMPDAGVAQALMDAAGDARGRAAFAAAARGFARAGELHVDDDARAHALLEAAGAATIAGELSRAVELADQGARLAADPLLQADLRAMSRAHADPARRPGPRRPGARARGRADRGPRPRARGRVPARVGGHAHDRRHAAGDGRDRRARVKEVTGGEAPGLEFLATLLTAEALLALGDTEEGDALLAACEPVLLGDEPVLGPPEVLGMAGALVAVDRERFERAEAIFDRLIGSLRDVGAAGALVYPLAARSHLDFRLGRWPAALAGADEAVTLARETHQESLLAHALGALAEVEAGLGRAEDARAHATESVGLLQAQGAPATAIYGYQRSGCSSSGSATSRPPATTASRPSARSARPRATSRASRRYAPDLLEVLRARRPRRRGAAAARRARAPAATGRPRGCSAIVERIRGLMAPDDEVRRALRARAGAPRRDAPAVRDRPHPAPARRAAAARQAPRRRPRAARPRARGVRAARRRAVGGARPRRAARHRRPDRLGRARDRHRRADRPGAPDRAAGGAGPHEPRGRRRALPQRRRRSSTTSARSTASSGSAAGGARGGSSASPAVEAGAVNGAQCRSRPASLSAFRSPRTAHAQNPSAARTRSRRRARRRRLARDQVAAGLDQRVNGLTCATAWTQPEQRERHVHRREEEHEEDRHLHQRAGLDRAQAHRDAGRPQRRGEVDEQREHERARTGRRRRRRPASRSTSATTNSSAPTIAARARAPRARSRRGSRAGSAPPASAAARSRSRSRRRSPKPVNTPPNAADCSSTNTNWNAV